MDKRRELIQHRDFLKFEPLMDLRQSMDHLFEDFFSSHGSHSTMPKSNIFESPKDYHIEIQVPGMSESDLDISLVNHVLTISGESKSEHKKDDKNYHRIEFSSSAINRSWELPLNVDIENLSANFKDGILDIVLPKKHVSDVNKKIEINKH